MTPRASRTTTRTTPEPASAAPAPRSAAWPGAGRERSRADPAAAAGPADGTEADRAQAAVAVGLDDPPGQPHPPEPGRAEGRRASGELRLGDQHHDGAVFRHPAAAGPGRGQAACRAGVPRHQPAAGPADAGEDGGAAADGWG